MRCIYNCSMLQETNSESSGVTQAISNMMDLYQNAKPVFDHRLSTNRSSKKKMGMGWKFCVELQPMTTNATVTACSEERNTMEFPFL